MKYSGQWNYKTDTPFVLKCLFGVLFKSFQNKSTIYPFISSQKIFFIKKDPSVRNFQLHKINFEKTQTKQEIQNLCKKVDIEKQMKETSWKFIEFKNNKCDCLQMWVVLNVIFRHEVFIYELWRVLQSWNIKITCWVSTINEGLKFNFDLDLQYEGLTQVFTWWITILWT